MDAPYASDDYTSKQPEAAKPQEPAPDYEAEAKAAAEDAELVARAKECYRIGTDTLSRWRQEALQDLEFLAGEQWDQYVKGLRDAQGRPALTINRLPQFVQQVTNEQRQSKPAITVSPMDSSGSKEVAEVIQGVIRGIEYKSNAEVAYAAGGASAAITGLGYWDVRADYEDERSFEQELSIVRIKNPMSVVMDPGAKEQAGDDARWVCISTDLSKSEWEATYPGKEMPKGNGGWKAEGDAPADWVAKDGVRIHEYRWVVEEEDELIDLSQAHPVVLTAIQSNGVDVSTNAVLASEVGPKFAESLRRVKLPVRKTTKRVAKWAKIAGEEVIEKGELAGRFLQLVRVVGSEVNIDGKEVFWGIIRHAKDTQRMLNYAVSAEAEAIALAPKSPWIIAEGQIEGHEEEWRTANQRPLSALVYKPTTVAGVAVPQPQRVNAEANVVAINQSRQLAAEDLSGVTGIYPTQFGAPAPEQSGKAILARQSQGQTGNFHLMDNLAVAIKYTGRILVDLIPKYYSEKRIVRIVGADESQEMVPVNQPGINDKTGKPFVQLDSGRYDVAVSMGPSYLSKRQEAAAQMLELARIRPELVQVAGDLMVASMDIPDGDVIAERLAKLLPPEIRPQDNDMPPPAVMAQQLQQMQQQSQTMQQMIGALSERLHNAHDKLDTRQQDIESKERIALLNAQVELLKTKAQLNSADANKALDRKLELIQARLTLDGINEPMDDASTTEQPRGVSAVLKQIQQPQPQQPSGALNVRPQPGAIPAGPGPSAGSPGAGGPLPGAGPIGPGIP